MSTTFILLHPDDFTEKTTQEIAYAGNNAIQRGAAEVPFPDVEYVKCETREDCLNAVVSGRATCTIASAATINLMKQYKVMKSLNVVELPEAVEICLGTMRNGVRQARDHGVCRAHRPGHVPRLRL